MYALYGERVCLSCVCVCVCVCLHVGRTVWSTGILLWVCVGLFSTRDAGSVDWNPSGHQGHLIPSLPEHWTKCSCIIHVYITLLLCKVFTQSFCRTIYCTYPQTLTDKLCPISLSLSFSLSVSLIDPLFRDDDKILSEEVVPNCSVLWFTPP